MSSSSSSNHLVNNQRIDGRSQSNNQTNNNGGSSSIADIYQMPALSSSSAFQPNQFQKNSSNLHHAQTNYPQYQPNHLQHQQSQPPNAPHLSRSAIKDHEMSMSAALQRLSQHHTMQQASPLSKQRTFSTSAISSVHTNFHNNQANLSNYSKRIEDLTKIVTAQQHNHAVHNSQTPHHQQRHQNQQPQQPIQDHQLDRDYEETIIKEEEFENALEGFKETELEALGSLERNLPVELSFLIRQQAYCMARMNYLDRQIRELQRGSSQNYVDPNATQVSSTSTALNLRLQGHQFHHHQHHQQQQMLNAQGQPMTATTTKNGNFILSDDSGGEYSRATISDDDELSSLLDQIAKSVRPDQPRVAGSGVNLISNNNISQSMPPPHHLDQQSLLNNPLQTRPMAVTNYSAFQSNQQQPHHHHHQQQQYAIINPSQMHSHHQQAVPIFVMSSPIVPVAHHPSSISSNILPGVHFQPEPRYNQYYEDFYCNGLNVNQTASAATLSSAVPSGVTMIMPTRQQQFAPQHLRQQQQQQQLHHHGLKSSQQQQMDSGMTAIEQLVSQKEKRQIMSQLKTADNWLKMRSSTTASNKGNPNESSFNIGCNNNSNNDNANFSGPSVRPSASSSSTIAPTTQRETMNLAQQQAPTSDRTSSNNIDLTTVVEQTNAVITAIAEDKG